MYAFIDKRERKRPPRFEYQDKMNMLKNKFIRNDKKNSLIFSLFKLVSYLPDLIK